MKKSLLIAILAIACFWMPKSASAQNLSMDRPLIWGPSPFQDSLWAIDTTNWTVVNRLAPSMPGYTITGITAMAMDPTTGITYVVAKVSGVTGRVLATISLPSGVTTPVNGTAPASSLGTNFSSITFDSYGQMYGATGNGATPPETMFLINKNDATKTLLYGMGNGVDGEILCYNKLDSNIYHWSGNGTVVMEKMLYSNTSYTPTNIPTSGTPSGEIFGAMYNGNNNFIISTISSNFRRMSSAGAYGTGNLIGLPDDLRGMVMLPYFTVSNDSICTNETFTITGGGHQLFDNFIYHWGDGTSDTLATINGTLTIGNHNYSTGGVYTVCVETDNSFSGDTVYTYQLNVGNTPVIALGGLTAICSGNPTTLVANAPAGTYQWYMNGSPMPGETNSSVTVTTAGVYNMICTTVFGCSDSATTGLSVVVSTYPVVDLGADTAACSSLVLDAGNAGSTFMWGDGSTTQSISLTTSTGIGVTVTNAEGCATYDSINVTINTPPTVNVGPDTTVCGSYMVDAGNPGSSYMWCDGSTAQTTVLVNSGVCAVTVTDANGCSSSDSINVVINPNPIVTLGPDIGSCTSATVYADSIPVSGTYMWCDSTGGNSHLFTSTGTCDVTFTDINGCVGRDTITVTIFGVPTVTASASTLTPCADDANVVLTGTPAGGTFFGPSLSGNQFDPSIGAGSYQIMYNYTDANGCTNYDSVQIVVSACVGINEVSANEFTLFPNPSTGVINMNLPESGTTVEVVDVLGNVIVSKNFSNAGTAQLDLSAQSNGVYFVRVINGSSKDVKRVVIQK